MIKPFQSYQNWIRVFQNSSVFSKFLIRALVLSLPLIAISMSTAWGDMTRQCMDAAQGYINYSNQYKPVFDSLNDAIQKNLTTAAMQQTATDFRSLQTEAAQLRKQFATYHSQCESDPQNVLAQQRSSIENFNNKANIIITKAKAAYGSSAPSPSAYQSFNRYLDTLNTINQNALSGVNVPITDEYADLEKPTDEAPEAPRELVYTGEPISDDDLLLYKKYLDDIQQAYALKNMNSYNLGSTNNSSSGISTCVYEKQKKGELNTMMDAVEQAEDGGLICGRSFVLTAALQLQYETRKKCGAPPSELAELRKQMDLASRASLEPYCMYKAQTNTLGVSEGAGSGFSMLDALDIAVSAFAIGGTVAGHGNNMIPLYQNYMYARTGDSAYLTGINQPVPGSMNPADPNTQTANAQTGQSQASNTTTQPGKETAKRTTGAGRSGCIVDSVVQTTRSSVPPEGPCITRIKNVCYDDVHTVKFFNKCKDRSADFEYELGTKRGRMFLAPGSSSTAECWTKKQSCSGKANIFYINE